MTQAGMGVMINELFSAHGGDVLQSAIGKTIKKLYIDDNRLHFEFTDDTHIVLFDDGQSCCELRYMRTDDDLDYYIGAMFLDADVSAGPPVEDEGEVHEVEFLIVKTSIGDFTLSNHNEHNGYYGGFYIKAYDFNKKEEV